MLNLLSCSQQKPPPWLLPVCTSATFYKSFAGFKTHRILQMAGKFPWNFYMLKAMANNEHKKISSSSGFQKPHIRNFQQNLKSTTPDESHKHRRNKCGCQRNFFKHKAIQRTLSRFGYQRQITSQHCQGTPRYPILKWCILKNQKANNNGSQRRLTVIDKRGRTHLTLSQLQTTSLLKLL